MYIFFFKQKTAYEMCGRDWSSDVCSSDLWQYVTLISPVFVTFLLTKVSGVPLLEQRSDEKWGGQEDYEAYKARRPVLRRKPPWRG